MVFKLSMHVTVDRQNDILSIETKNPHFPVAEPPQRFKSIECAEKNIEKSAERLLDTFNQLGAGSGSLHITRCEGVLQNFEFQVVTDDPLFFSLCGLKAAGIFKQVFPERVPDIQDIEKIEKDLTSSEPSVAREKAKVFLRIPEENPAVISPSIPLQAFHEMTRRVPKEELEPVLSGLASLSPLTSLELDALRKGQWAAPIFTDPSWPLKALKAFKENLLNVNQICKLFLYEAGTKYTLKTHALFDEKGSVQTASVELFKKGVQTYFNEDHLRAFLFEASQYPPEESQFFAIEVSKESSLDMENLYARNLAENCAHLQLFIVEEEDKWIHLVVPPSLSYELYKTKYGMNAMKPLPAFGYSKVERFSDPTQRVIHIPCPFFKSPTAIHDIPSVPLVVHYHDLAFHHYLESANIHRAAWVELAKALKAAGLVQSSYITLDRPFPIYGVPDVTKGSTGQLSLPPQDYFWVSLAYLKKIVSMDKDAQKEEQQLISCVLEYIQKHNSDWSDKYGLELDGLKKCYESYTLNEAITLKPWIDHLDLKTGSGLAFGHSRSELGV